MNSYDIFKKANNIVESCSTRDPMRIASDLNIYVKTNDAFEDLLGAYFCCLNHRIIIINSRLYGYLLKMVMAHEIGHDQLHRALAKSGTKLQEFNLFMEKDLTEYEANAFASHILLPNDDIYSLAKQGIDVITMAKMVNVDYNLLLIKLNEMQKMDYKFNIPFDADPTFFKKIRT